jgi:hypothetical protein
MNWLMEIAGILLVAGGVGYVWPPAAAVLVGVYLVTAANVRGR